MSFKKRQFIDIFLWWGEYGRTILVVSGVMVAAILMYLNYLETFNSDSEHIVGEIIGFKIIDGRGSRLLLVVETAHDHVVFVNVSQNNNLYKKGEIVNLTVYRSNIFGIPKYYFQSFVDEE